MHRANCEAWKYGRQTQIIQQGVKKPRETALTYKDKLRKLKADLTTPKLTEDEEWQENADAQLELLTNIADKAKRRI